ncbi:hypothetical protein BB561_004258 [Smittium simulii]|uniref:Phosphatidylinositol-specific phospholipase C X domain-containing protein n=1 Tax=Smittium simulii TaxID=133385 RepID=A0A2T9YH59_9FUNG|nr:hypothetical protein BB561_004258 [Smittium simulii]
MYLFFSFASSALLLILSALPNSSGSNPLLYSKRQAEQSCNGYSDLCSRPYNKVSFLTSHNAFAYTTGNNASNQNEPITKQLDRGVRAFMLDLHDPDKITNLRSSNKLDKRQTTFKKIELCHATCLLLDSAPFVTELQNFKKYIDAQPNNVITLFLENYDRFSSAEMYGSFAQAGLADMLFNPITYTLNGVITWPTLQTIINSKKNIIVLSDSITNQVSYPQIMLDRLHVAQTSFSVASGSAFDCNLSQAGLELTAVNHFVYINQGILNSGYRVPSLDASKSVNSIYNINQHVNTCLTKIPPSFPNFFALDFYQYGDGFKAVSSFNNIAFKDTSTSVFSEPKKNSASLLAPLYEYNMLLLYFSAFLLFIK